MRMELARMKPPCEGWARSACELPVGPTCSNCYAHRDVGSRTVSSTMCSPRTGHTLLVVKVGGLPGIHIDCRYGALSVHRWDGLRYSVEDVPCVLVSLEDIWRLRIQVLVLIPCTCQGTSYTNCWASVERRLDRQGPEKKANLMTHAACFPVVLKSSHRLPCYPVLRLLLLRPPALVVR